MLMKQIRKIKDIDKKWLRNLVKFISVVGWLSLTRLCVYCSLHADNMIFHKWGIVFATFFSCRICFLEACMVIFLRM